VEAAVQEARDAPFPDPAQALTDVWADGGAAWRS
jgi:acetoin:2,6-dichlorophenolindophenol oxidoreductase subunit alpha